VIAHRILIQRENRKAAAVRCNSSGSSQAVVQFRWTKTTRCPRLDCTRRQLVSALGAQVRSERERRWPVLIVLGRSPRSYYVGSVFRLKRPKVAEHWSESTRLAHFCPVG